MDDYGYPIDYRRPRLRLKRRGSLCTFGYFGRYGMTSHELYLYRQQVI